MFPPNLNDILPDNIYLPFTMYTHTRKHLPVEMYNEWALLQ